MKKSKYSLEKKKVIVSEENAHVQIMQLLERNNINVDKLDEDEIVKVEKCLDTITSAIIYGQIEVLEEDGKVKIKQNILLRGEKSTVDHLIYGEVTGTAHIDMSSSDNHLERALSLMSNICETNGANAIIKQLRSSDLSIAEALSVLFL